MNGKDTAGGFMAKRSWLALVMGLLLVAGGASGQERARIESVREALMISSRLSGAGGPENVNWIGERFVYTRRGGLRTPTEVRVYDPKSLADEALFDPQKLTMPGTTEPLSYRSFEISADGKHLIFQTNYRPIYRRSGLADFYIYTLPGGELRLGVKNARTADLSPDGRLLGFERGGNLYVRDLDTGSEKQLTDVDGDSIFNGVFDWVYEEEFGFAQAWKWGPDSKRIAFWQTDERGVPVVQITDWSGQYPKWTKLNYPKVGAHNPQVKIGIVDVGTGEQRWMDVGVQEDHYVPRIYWTSDPNTLAVVVLNRAQNHLQLFFFDVRTGAKRLVMEERSKGWIDVYDFFAGVNDYFYFPQDVREFFWISDRDGYNHLYRYGYDGKLLNQVTKGNWVVTRVEGIDPKSKTIYYSSTEASPLQRQLYSIRFDGTREHRLTEESGTHDIDMGPSAKYYLDRWSNTGTPRQIEIWSTAGGGRMLKKLEDNAQVRDYVATHVYSPLQLFSFTTADGQKLDGSMIRPPDFDPSKKYPVLLSIYGGPGSQQVYDAWATNGWQQYLAQQGYIVVGLNNRGSGNYGRDFMEVVYGELGKWEAYDFAAVANWLAKQGSADPARMAIQGTSYGGFMTLATLLRHPGVFALGLSNSPVTDWRLYDSIYTERYMGLLSQNEAGYERTSLIPRADQLDAYLLLVHSGMDENVQPQNTMQMLTALAKAGKDADFLFYPPGAHGAAFDLASYVTMTEVYTNELCKHIAVSCVPQDLNK